MVQNVIIIHGTHGSPEENWFPWLKSELEQLGCKVFAPKFPTPENQSLETWLKVFEDYKNYLDENSIIIGHSLGPVFILHLLEKINHPIKAVFFVAPFVSSLNNPEFDNLNKTFYKTIFNWNKIKQNCKHFFVYCSDNDPYVPIEKCKDVSNNLGIEIKIVPNAGHFNEKAGYKKFNLLLEDITNLIEQKQ